MENFLMRCVTSRQSVTHGDGEQTHISASRTVNSLGVQWITLKVGKDELTLNFGGEEESAMKVASAIVAVLCEVRQADVTLPAEGLAK